MSFFDFFKKKQLSEYTDDEIRDKLSSVLSPDTNPNYINNIINEANKRGINVKLKVLDIGKIASVNKVFEFSGLRRAKTDTLLSLASLKQNDDIEEVLKKANFKFVGLDVKPKNIQILGEGKWQLKT